jgi:ATP-dependent Clp protease ATP-binding subunit ClpA
MESAHIFYALLSCNRISNIFIRLGIPSSVLLKEAEALCVNNTPTHAGVSPRLSDDVLQIIFQSYENAFAAKQPYVSVTELLMFAIAANPAIQNILFNYDISERQLANVVAWARMKEKMHRDYLVFKKAVKHHQSMAWIEL